MDDYETFEFLEADAERDLSRKNRRKVSRQNFDPFEMDDGEFVRTYRLTKDLVKNLCDEIKPLIKVPTKTSDLSVETKVLTALAFYATGSYQRPIGAIEGHSMAQQTVSSVLKQITECLNCLEIQEKYINFPRNSQDRNRVKTKFYQKFGIPGVLGCIDGTHVAIARPTSHEERFYCRKHYHSLNVQLVCDADMNILSVDASHGGASHDSHIWANHPLLNHLEELSNTENVWFLGDSGYPLRKTMMTPILDAAPNSPEAFYTDIHVRTRNIVERTIGLLKARFRCLLVHRVLHYAPEVAGSIVNACVVLHNICNRARVPVDLLSNEEALQEAQSQVTSSQMTSAMMSHNNTGLQQGSMLRNALVTQLWEQRSL